MPQKICLQHFFWKTVGDSWKLCDLWKLCDQLFFATKFSFFMEVNPTVLCFQRNKFYAINV